MPTIPYVHQTWTDGVSALSAARMNVIEDGVFNISFAPAVRVFHNAAQATTTGVALALAFNSERFDQAANTADTMHDTVTNNSRLTCRYAGVYQITAMIEWAANATGARRLDIRLNGATIIAADLILPVTGGAATNQSVTCLYSLAVNDFVEALATQSSGAGLNVNSTGNVSPEFSMVRVA